MVTGYLIRAWEIKQIMGGLFAEREKRRSVMDPGLKPPCASKAVVLIRGWQGKGRQRIGEERENMKRASRVKWMTLIIIAAAHFGLSHLIFPITAALAARTAGEPGAPGMAVTLLVRVTRLLHLPLVTLALYPREWFPGDWVYVPMALNSAIWAFGIYGLIVWFRKCR